MTVEQLSLVMDYDEFRQWAALYDVEGEEQRRMIERAKKGTT